MARPRKTKKPVRQKAVVAEIQEKQAVEDTEIQKKEIPKADDPVVEKDLLRVDEAATYFGVSSNCIKLWIDHGHLQKAKNPGPIRVTRASILRCRFKRYSSEPLL